MAFLCVDIGGTNTLIGVGNGDFQKLEQVKTADFLESIEDTIENVLSDAGYSSVEMVSVAAAGPVDREEGLFYPPNIDKECVQIREPLENFAETRIVNDCAAAVLGEYHYGESAEDLLYVTVSSGIGAAYISDGEMVEGFNGNFGEVGHMRIGDNLECGCGGTGHWEAYCSGENIPEMAENLYNIDLDHPRQLFQKESAEEALSEFCKRMRLGVANLINLYNPEKIVFGGAVALNHFDVIEESTEGLEEEIVNEVPDIKLCGLGENSVLHGLRASCEKN